VTAGPGGRPGRQQATVVGVPESTGERLDLVGRKLEFEGRHRDVMKPRLVAARSPPKAQQ
jgi:hypothetical protein